MGAEEALRALGKFGRWQVLHYTIMIVLKAVPTAWQLFVIVFIGYGETPFHCKVDTSLPANHSIPMKDGSLSQCSVYKYNRSYLPNETKPCTDGYIYYPEYFEPEVGTIFMEWDLVCDDAFFVSLSQIIFQTGYCSGGLIFPVFADRFGRKPLFFFCQIVIVLFGIAMAFSPNYVAFCCFQAITGAFCMGNDVGGFILATEMFTAEERIYISPVARMFMPIGMLILILFAYFIRNWRTLQFVISVVSSVTILYWRHCPESLRWLVATGRIKEAEKTLETAAKFNNKNIPLEILHEEVDIPHKEKSHGLCSYFTHWKTIMYFIVLSYELLVTNLMIYGLGYMAQVFYGNLYSVLAIGVALEIPGIVLAMILLSFLGRRHTLLIFNLISAVFIFLAAIFNLMDTVGDLSGNQKATLVTAMALLSKFGVGGCFSIEAVFIQEIFPTYMRSSGLGACACIGLLGATLAPVISYVAQTENSTTSVSFAFGAMSVVGALAALLLPETLGRPSPNTMKEVLSWPFNLTKEERQNVRQKRNWFGHRSEEPQVKLEKRKVQATDGIYPGGQFNKVNESQGHQNPAFNI